MKFKFWFAHKANIVQGNECLKKKKVENSSEFIFPVVDQASELNRFFSQFSCWCSRILSLLNVLMVQV